MKKKISKNYRDPNRLAKAVVDLATMDEKELAEFRAEREKALTRKANQASPKGKKGSLGK